ncbi:MAG: nitroreductase family protein [bacterium]|nr:nitroreductase family protein [bacterium]
MQDNYKPWAVDYKDFYNLTEKEDRLKFLLRFALLAPSSHNSQPWRFKISDNKIFVYPEEKRALPKSDKNGRQLHLSLGTALENLLVAADFYGYKTGVNYFPSESPDAVMTVEFQETESVKHGDDAIVKSILSRHANRNKYSNKKLPEEFLVRVKSLSRDGFRVYVIQDKKLKDKISDVVSDALIEAMDDRDFRSELSGYIKSNTTKAKTGMPMFGFGMPTILSYLAPAVLKRFNMNKLSRSQDEALLKDHTPYFVIITSEADNRESWIKTGQIFESIALMVGREGANTAPMAAAIQIGEHYKRLQKILGTGLRPQFFFRMGFADLPVHHSPRLGLDDVLEKEY